MPATVDHIRTISTQGERMPAKSTYFYPKLLSGLVSTRWSDEACRCGDGLVGDSRAAACHEAAPVVLGRQP